MPQPHYVPVCAYLEWNLDGLVEMVWDYLDLQRVYTKPKGRLPDFGDPVVLRRDRATVEDFANRIHKGEEMILEGYFGVRRERDAVLGLLGWLCVCMCVEFCAARPLLSSSPRAPKNRPTN